MPLEITPLFVAGLVIFQVVITNFVGYRRLQTGIRFLDGGEETLTRRMRAHGNFTETVPITLIAMASAELLGIAPWILWTGGALLAIGRVWHYFYIVSKGWGHGRSLSMVTTFAAMLTFAISIILKYL